MFSDLGWVGKVCGIVIALLIGAILLTDWLYPAQPIELVLDLIWFALAHVVLLLWLSFAIKLVWQDGGDISLQIRWRESDKVLFQSNQKTTVN